MSNIVPYVKGITKSDGAFIFPNNEVKLINSHMGYALDYIRGNDCEHLLDLQRDAFDKIDEEYKLAAFNEYIRVHNLSWKSRNDINPFISSKLNDEERFLLNKWEEEYEFRSRDLYTDFLIYVLGIDKVQTIKRMCITTTEQYPYIRYYNYFLMGFELDLLDPMRYNKDLNEYEYYDRKQSIVLENKNIKYRDEIEELKSKIPVKDRHLYFK